MQGLGIWKIKIRRLVTKTFEWRKVFQNRSRIWKYCAPMRKLCQGPLWVALNHHVAIQDSVNVHCLCPLWWIGSWTMWSWWQRQKWCMGPVAQSWSQLPLLLNYIKVLNSASLSEHQPAAQWQLTTWDPFFHEVTVISTHLSNTYYLWFCIHCSWCLLALWGIGSLKALFTIRVSHTKLPLYSTAKEVTTWYLISIGVYLSFHVLHHP